MVLTHGNGPQVGANCSVRNAEQARSLDSRSTFVAPRPRVKLVISSINHWKANALAGLNIPVATVVTQSLVSLDDPAMQHPSKPIGPFYSRADAEERKRLFGWQIVEDAARGYRRVVPSPDPIEIVELEVIRDLVEQGVLVIACGGGGIPVVWSNGGLQGVEAVIDKDLASALLASRLGADLFVISTDADCVYLDYKKPTQRPLGRVKRRSWSNTPGLAIFRPATWAQRSNPCCASCATAARKPLLRRARICARRLLERAAKLRQAHTCSPVANGRKSNLTCNSKFR